MINPFRSRPNDLVGHSIEEYRHLPCGECGGTEKMIDVITDERDGFSQLVLACCECGYANKWTGHIPRNRF